MVAEVKKPETEYPNILKAFPVGAAIVSKNDTRPDTHGEVTKHLTPGLIEITWENGNTGCFHWKLIEEMRISKVRRKLAGSESAIAPATPTEIIPGDEERLELLEESIADGLEQIEAGKQRVWQAVSEIQRHQLWRVSGHESFEAYCKIRWGWERSNAYEVAQAGEITAELIESGVPDSDLPTSVAQVRALRRVEPEKRVEVLQTAIATTNGNPTAKAIRQAASSVIESDENYTSAGLIEAVRRVLGRIDLDVASCELANEVVGATVYFTREQDGLKQPWKVPSKTQITVWDNCPYSMPLVQQFSDRHCAEWVAGTIEASIAIRNNATETKWFQRLAKTCTVRLDLNAREQFYNPYKSYEKSNNRQGQTLFYFGHKPERFYAEFEGRGLFYPAPPAVEVAPLECTPSITPAEFNREMALPKFTGCHLCKYRVLSGSGDRYWCDQGEFDDTLPLKYNWKIENEGCKSYVEPNAAIAQPPSTDTRAAMPAIQKAVWEWLNLHGIEADEATADTAADLIFEFLQGQFLEVQDA